MINFFYISKKYLKWAGFLDLICMVCWTMMIFVISVSKVFISVDDSKGILETIKEKTVVNLIFMNISVYSVFIFLFSVAIVAFSLKTFFSFCSLCFFIKSKSLRHVFASVSVLLFPLLGGIIAINTYHATVSSLAPKYVASNSLIRSRFKKFLLSITKDEY